MSDGRVTFARDGAVARIVLDRPDKLNALTPAMLAELGDIAERIDKDDDIRVVVLSASGDRVFCVGADIEAWAGAEPLHIWRHWVRDGHAVFDRMVRLRQPLIAAIEGLALGGGLELAATCDLRVAGADAGLEAVAAGTPGLRPAIMPAPDASDGDARLPAGLWHEALALVQPQDAGRRVGATPPTSRLDAGLPRAGTRIRQGSNPKRNGRVFRRHTDSRRRLYQATSATTRGRL